MHVGFDETRVIRQPGRDLPRGCRIRMRHAGVADGRAAAPGSGYARRTQASTRHASPGRENRIPHDARPGAATCSAPASLYPVGDRPPSRKTVRRLRHDRDLPANRDKPPCDLDTAVRTSSALSRRRRQRLSIWPSLRKLARRSRGSLLYPMGKGCWPGVLSARTRRPRTPRDLRAWRQRLGGAMGCRCPPEESESPRGEPTIIPPARQTHLQRPTPTRDGRYAPAPTRDWIP